LNRELSFSESKVPDKKESGNPPFGGKAGLKNKIPQKGGIDVPGCFHTFAEKKYVSLR
jgi:hypothetical protein